MESSLSALGLSNSKSGLAPPSALLFQVVSQGWRENIWQNNLPLVLCQGGGLAFSGGLLSLFGEAEMG